MSEASVLSPWVDIGRIDDIPRLGARIVATSRGDIAVFRAADDRIFALEDHCPHKQGPLSQGIVHGTRVTCPLHGWVIELESGEAVAPDQGCTPKIEVHVKNGRILLDLQPRAS